MSRKTIVIVNLSNTESLNILKKEKRRKP